jgi:hypothetical protein
MIQCVEEEEGLDGLCCGGLIVSKIDNNNFRVDFAPIGREDWVYQ